MASNTQTAAETRKQAREAAKAQKEASDAKEAVDGEKNGPVRSQGRGGVRTDPQTQMGELDLTDNADLVQLVGKLRKATDAAKAAGALQKAVKDAKLDVLKVLPNNDTGQVRRIRVGTEVIVDTPEKEPSEISFTRRPSRTISLEKKE